MILDSWASYCYIADLIINFHKIIEIWLGYSFSGYADSDYFQNLDIRVLLSLLHIKLHFKKPDEGFIITKQGFMSLKCTSPIIVSEGIIKIMICSAWFRLKLITKITLDTVLSLAPHSIVFGTTTTNSCAFYSLSKPRIY